jgi:prepilin-type N-terminal cleavage/methylation domain-containing protein
VTRHLRSDRGFVLTEVLVVLVVSSILLGATLVTFAGLVTNSKESDTRQDTVEQARLTLDREARQLRNLAKRLNNAAVIDTVGAYDFIFQTSDPSRTWVRYCLNTAPGTDRAQLIEQAQALAPTAGGSPVTAAMRTGCPSSSGWTRTAAVANAVTNRASGQDRALFSYRCVDGTTGCTASASTFDQIVGVEASLFVNTTPARPQEEMKVNSSVFLRNQNQAPVARITTPPVSPAPRTLLFNASGSTDFENRTLQFFWFLNTMPDTAQIRCDQASEVETLPGLMWGGNLIGRGIIYEYTWPGATPPKGANQTIGLVACDPGDRFGYSGAMTVQIP